MTVIGIETGAETPRLRECRLLQIDSGLEGGIASEQVVRRAVFLNDENDVLESSLLNGLGVRTCRSEGNQTQQTSERELHADLLIREQNF
jgi:hypothetical protein